MLAAACGVAYWRVEITASCTARRSLTSAPAPPRTAWASLTRSRTIRCSRARSTRLPSVSLGSLSSTLRSRCRCCCCSTVRRCAFGIDPFRIEMSALVRPFSCVHSAGRGRDCLREGAQPARGDADARAFRVRVVALVRASGGDRSLLDGALHHLDGLRV
eukprot:6523533-Prymnesium_polylepis.3